MTRLIEKVTGDKTAKFGFRGTDLGFITRTNHGYNLVTFGDTFDNPMPGGSGWRSPVILRTNDSDLSNGLTWDNAVGGARAKQAVDYVHNTNTATNSIDSPYTVIPNDVIHLPDNTYLMSAFHVKSWDSTSVTSWTTHANVFYHSTETHAEVWEKSMWRDIPGRVMFLNDGQQWRLFQNASLVLDGEYLYMFGTQTGRYQGGAVYLARVPWRKWHTFNAWELYNGNDVNGVPVWGHNAVAKPVFKPTLTNGAIGEINVRRIGGKFVAAYIDYATGALVTRTADTPWGEWSGVQVHTTNMEFPNFYAPALHPSSTLERPYVLLSQWTDSFYGSSLVELNPIKLPAAAGEATPSDDGGEPTPVPTVPIASLDAEKLASILMGETTIQPSELIEALKKYL